MKVAAGKDYAVITGDIVHSSELKPAARKALLAEMRRAATATRRAFPKAGVLPLDVFRGDGWQLFVTAPAASVRVALFFRASLLAHSPVSARFETRLAIGIGPVTFVPKRVSQGDGEAFRASGAALEALGRKQWMSVAFAPKPTPRAINVVVGLIDSHVQSWTAAQGRAIVGALQGWPQERIARLWPEPIRQPTVGAHLDKAGWPAVAPAIEWLEAAIAGSDIAQI